MPESCPQNGDLPKWPLIKIGSLLPSAGTRSLSTIDVGSDREGCGYPQSAYHAMSMHGCLLEATKEKNMKMKIAILAACAGAVVFAATTCAYARSKGSPSTGTIKQTSIVSKPSTRVNFAPNVARKVHVLAKTRDQKVAKPVIRLDAGTEQQSDQAQKVMGSGSSN